MLRHIASFLDPYVQPLLTIQAAYSPATQFKITHIPRCLCRSIGNIVRIDDSDTVKPGGKKTRIKPFRKIFSGQNHTALIRS